MTTSSESLGNATNIIPQTAPEADGKEEAEARLLPRVRKSGRNLQDNSASVKLVITVLGVLFVLFMILMHYSLSSGTNLNANEANQSSDGLYYTMKISSRHSPKDPIMLLMSITNTSPVPKTLNFDKDTQVDFIIQNRVNLFFEYLPIEVWRYSKSKNAYINNQRSLTILPNEERVFPVKWNQIDNEGNRVQSGRYIITCQVNTTGGARNLKIGG
ncbi:hypothetical protein IJT93_09650 [bacterium]|nr:hypothetical protein [bacterium]